MHWHQSHIITVGALMGDKSSHSYYMWLWDWFFIVSKTLDKLMTIYIRDSTLTSKDWWSIYSLIDPLASDAAGSMVRSAGELGLSAVSVRMMNYDNIAHVSWQFDQCHIYIRRRYSLPVTIMIQRRRVAPLADDWCERRPIKSSSRHRE